MKYLKLGNTEITPSIIGFGGEWLNGKTLEETKALIDYGMDRGINYIDIFMPQPETRSNIGNAIKGKRDKIYIQGHLCTVFENDQYERTRDLEKTKIGFNDLLTRLNTNYIDVGMIHYVDTFEDLSTLYENKIIDYVKDLKDKGIIKYIGVSSHNPHVALKVVEDGLAEVLMFSINPAYDLQKSDADIYELSDFKAIAPEGFIVDPARQKLYATCENIGVGITVMKALGSGSLLIDETSPFSIAMTVPQCCHYCLTRPSVCSVLIGFESIPHIDDALEYLTATAEEKNYSHIFTSKKTFSMDGRCMYCNHCLPCPAHIDIAMVTKLLDLALIKNSVPETVSEHYKSLKNNASQCIGCGSCEKNCPFGVKIIDNMKMAEEIFR